VKNKDNEKSKDNNQYNVCFNPENHSKNIVILQIDLLFKNNSDAHVELEKWDVLNYE